MIDQAIIRGVYDELHEDFLRFGPVSVERALEFERQQVFARRLQTHEARRYYLGRHQQNRGVAIWGKAKADETERHRKHFGYGVCPMST